MPDKSRRGVGVSREAPRKRPVAAAHVAESRSLVNVEVVDDQGELRLDRAQVAQRVSLTAIAVIAALVVHAFGRLHFQLCLRCKTHQAQRLKANAGPNMLDRASFRRSLSDHNLCFDDRFVGGPAVIIRLVKGGIELIGS